MIRWPPAVGWMPSDMLSFRDAGHILKKEWHEYDVVGIGQGLENLPETAGVLIAHVRRGFHAGKYDFDAGTIFADLVHDLLQVFAGVVGIESAQAVVAAQSQHEDVERALQDPVDAAQPAGSGLTAHAGIDRLHGESERIGPILDERGKRLVRIQSVSGRDAVTEEKDGDFFPARVCCGGEKGKKGALLGGDGVLS
jgi:hypothetical protein